jgi:ferrous iron transport protein B
LFLRSHAGQPTSSKMDFTIALEGNPNTGKSTIFNAMTGLTQHVGNWPGKTVEWRSGTCKFKDFSIEVVDLPGTYSLKACSVEETIARDFILDEKPDVVVDIVNASKLEHDLLLALQTMELTDNVVISLNLMDVAKEEGLKIDVNKLSEMLGVPVIPTVANKGIGVNELLSAVTAVAKGEKKTKAVKVDYGKEIEGYIKELQTMTKMEEYPSRWLAIKLLENDSNVVDKVKAKNETETLREAASIRSSNSGQNLEIEVTKRVYAFIDKIVKETVTKPEQVKTGLTEKIDNIVANRVLGLPIALTVLATMFWVVFTVGEPFGAVLEDIFNWTAVAVKTWMISVNAPQPLISLIVEGEIVGVGTIIVFMLPPVTLMFLMFSILENSGYFARLAYIMDRIMGLFDLQGRTFITSLLGWGCNIPGVRGARIFQVGKDKDIAVITNPLNTCTGRLAVMFALISIFWSGNTATLVAISLILISVATVGFGGLILSRFVLPGKTEGFIMELPDYRRPMIRDIVMPTLRRIKLAMIKAVKIGAPAAAVLWFLSHYPGETVETSYAAMLGRFLEPAGLPLGLDWRMILCLIFAVPAKEIVLTTLASTYGLEVSLGAGAAENLSFRSLLLAGWTPLATYTFLVVYLLYIACLPTLVMQREELGSWKLTLFGAAFTFILTILIVLIIRGVSLFFSF